ncbi:MAG TPA: ACT domain-containing protein [Terriglobales bacterium]|nr:ACT domain-containing protein [Terriglobales bacterium]
MQAHRLEFSLLQDELSVCRLTPTAPIPEWSQNPGAFSCITRTREELSIVCASENVPADVQAEHKWIAFKLQGPFPFAQTGVLSSFIEPLSGNGIPIFAISTYDTDYVLIKADARSSALAFLREAGHTLI